MTNTVVVQYSVTAHKKGWKSFIHTYEESEHGYARRIANALSEDGWSVWFSEVKDGTAVLSTTNDLDKFLGKTTF